MRTEFPRRVTRLVALVMLLAPAAAFAQQAGGYDPALFGGLRWRNIGPNRGGRSIAVAGSAQRPFEYYFGATGGGVWKTTDGGTTWHPVADKDFRSSSPGGMAVCEANPDIVYVGMGETQLRGNVMQGDGVYKTADGGKTWTRAGLDDTHAIARVRVHPANCDVVYVAALGHIYGPNGERGVFSSRDGGKSWQKVLYRNDSTGAVDLALDPTNPNVMYAGFWEVYRASWTLSSGGPGGGLFKSTDGGDTWTELTRNPGLPQGLIGKVGVSVSGADPSRVFAIIEAEAGGVFRSDDAGATWTRVNEERRLRQRAFYYTRIYADPKDKETVYVLNTGFYRSRDGGKTYRPIRVPHGDNHDLWIDPTNPQRMINSNDGGANVSLNGGESWTEQDYPTAQMYHVITTKHVPYHVCGAQQDNSTACVPSNGSGSQWYAAGGGESGYIAPDPNNTDVFYAGSYGGHLTRLDRKTGQQRPINVWPENPMGHSASEIKERFQWTFPIVIPPLEPDVVLVGSQHLWRSTNGGQSWQRISPDLTRHDPKTMGPSGGPITRDQTGVETYATIFTIAPSRKERGTIWVGSDDGLVHITRNGGSSWSNVTPPGLPELSRISLIEASPHAPGKAYVAANRYQLDDRAPYIFNTEDYGKTWTKIVSGIPVGHFARAIREDPVRTGLLYAGTEHGVQISFDDGASWQSLLLELPDVAVHDLVVEGSDLVIGTHGRSFYVLDDLEPLRQLTPVVASADVHLYDSVDPARSVDDGAAVYYYLKQPAQKVTLEFLDAAGKLIRSYTGTPEDSAQRAQREQAEEDFRRFREPRVATKAGLQRFAWDMRHASATTWDGIILWAASPRGPRVVPGAYQVRLSVDDHPPQTQTFEVRKDPRLPMIAQADLEAQLELALRARNLTSEANEAVLLIRGVKAQVDERVKKANDAALTSAGESLNSVLGAVESEIYQVRNQSNQDPLNYPIKLNNKLAALMGHIDSGDGRPTEQAYRVFEDLSARLAVQLGKLNLALENDLARFNELLRARGLEPVERKPLEPRPVAAE